MRHSSMAALRSTLVAAVVWALPLTQYTPMSKWMAVPVLTLQQLEAGDI